MNTVAIMMPFPGVFKVFDSHSRDVFGRSSALNYCVLISVVGIENLGEYLQLTSRSNVVIPFELKGVKYIGNVDMETELSTRVITNSGMVNFPEVFEQCDINTKTLSSTIFEQVSTINVISNDSTEQSKSTGTTEQTKARLAKMRKYSDSKKEKRQNETTKQREARLAKMREYKNSKKSTRTNKTAGQREARLAKKRERELLEKELHLKMQLTSN